MNQNAPAPSPLHWYREAFRRYADFSGRSPRPAYWWFLLIHMLVWVALSFVWDVLAVIYLLAALLPGFGLFVRRMHDTTRSGWWWLISFVPFVGIVVLVVFLTNEGTRGANRWGLDPRTGEAEPVSGGFCSSCGNAVDADAAFCGTCGARRG